MRILLFFLICFFTSLPVFAAMELTAKVDSIDYGQAGDEPLIFLSTGQVVKLNQSQKQIWDQLGEALRSHKWFKMSINDDREITSIEDMIQPAARAPICPEKNLSSEPYHPSILKSLDEAKKYFSGAVYNPKESQCFNRAHVWTYEWRINKSLYSSKVWLFFTSKFIRKYNFGWWFHVSPMVHVVIDNSVKERVMDIKYSKGPINLKRWTDIFLRDRANCPVVEKYSDHANNPESGSCFVMKSSMYYYQPIDLENLETLGIERTTWLEADVKQAYLDAREIEFPGEHQ